jgi:Long-tail fiber proximal subunit, C-terminal, trimerization domain
MTANVAAALGNPQFNNLLATGAAQVNGALTVNGAFKLGATTITADASGSVRLTGSLGVGNPTSINDEVTINGLGIGNYGQLRMVYGAYGVFFRNDAQSLYLMVTAANDPYGTWAGNFPLFIDLATRNVGMAGWGPSASYGLNVPSVHANNITTDGDISASGRLLAASGFANTNGRSYFKSGDQYQIGLTYGNQTMYIGTNGSNQFQLSNVNGSSMLAVDPSGNAAFAGGVHALSGGFQFPDGSIQTTAAFNYVPPPPTGNFPGNITVNGVIYGPGSSSQSPVLYCFPFGSPPSAPPHSVLFSHNEGGNWVTIWVIKSDGSRWAANINLGPVA